jgi:rhodanese-related sulfurtransferase
MWSACVSPAAVASGTTPVSPVDASTGAALGGRELKAHCGVRCLYAAALKEGVSFPGADLVRPEYIGSREGSSIEELELAAHDHGLHTFAFVNGTVSALRLSTHPVILHVESEPGSGRYDHFVLYLRTRGNDVLVLDPTATPGEPAQALSPRALDLIWDGAGVTVSKAPIEKTPFAASWKQLLLCGGALIGLVVFGKLLTRRPAKFIRGFASCCVASEILAIAMLALLAPAVWAICAGGGLLAHGEQVKLVEQTHAAYFLPRVSFADAQKRLSEGSAVFVDARYSADYGAGHLPGAINVPVTASAALLPQYMRSVRTDAPVIVYCQSKSCPFSKSVATALQQQGYTSVQLLDGGWLEWSEWKH